VDEWMDEPTPTMLLIHRLAEMCPSEIIEWYDQAVMVGYPTSRLWLAIAWSSTASACAMVKTSPTKTATGSCGMPRASQSQELAWPVRLIPTENMGGPSAMGRANDRHVSLLLRQRSLDQIGTGVPYGFRSFRLKRDRRFQLAKRRAKTPREIPSAEKALSTSAIHQ
jgi:hypothetical protein